MTSQEARLLTTGFLTQVRGIFGGLEKLPDVLEEIERRESAVMTKEDSITALDTAIARKEARVAELDGQIRRNEPRAAELAAEVAVQTDKLARALADREALLAQLNLA